MPVGCCAQMANAVPCVNLGLFDDDFVPPLSGGLATLVLPGAAHQCKMSMNAGFLFGFLGSGIFNFTRVAVRRCNIHCFCVAIVITFRASLGWYDRADARCAYAMRIGFYPPNFQLGSSIPKRLRSCVGEAPEIALRFPACFSHK
jgi:hypothetical protein